MLDVAGPEYTLGWSYDGFTGCAKIYLLDSDGQPIGRLGRVCGIKASMGIDEVDSIEVRAYVHRMSDGRMVHPFNRGGPGQA